MYIVTENIKEKPCSRCGEVKSVSDFTIQKDNHGRSKRYSSWCKSCMSEVNTARQMNNREKYNKEVRDHRKEYSPEKRHAKHLRVKYGMTPDEYQAKFVSQGCVCAICERAETVLSTAVFNKAPKKLSVDHNHKTGEVRGLLCSNCNAAIGYFADDLSVLEKAILYLKRWAK